MKFKDFIYTISLFVLAIIVMLYATYITDGFAAIGIAVLSIMLAMMSILSLLFVFLQWKLNWKMTWWKYAIETVILFAITYVIVLVLTRI